MADVLYTLFATSSSVFLMKRMTAPFEFSVRIEVMVIGQFRPLVIPPQGDR